jgi:hypothetical protein
MMPECRKYAVREAPQNTSIARQRLDRRFSAAINNFVENKRFKTGSSHVGFVVDKVTLGQIFSE